MQFQTAKKWFVPYGTWIILSHTEACELTSGKSVGEITSAISAIGNIYAAIAAERVRDHGPARRQCLRGTLTPTGVMLDEVLQAQL